MASGFIHLEFDGNKAEKNEDAYIIYSKYIRIPDNDKPLMMTLKNILGLRDGTYILNRLRTEDEAAVYIFDMSFGAFVAVADGYMAFSFNA